MRVEVIRNEVRTSINVNSLDEIIDIRTIVDFVPGQDEYNTLTDRFTVDFDKKEIVGELKVIDAFDLEIEDKVWFG